MKSESLLLGFFLDSCPTVVGSLFVIFSLENEDGRAVVFSPALRISDIVPDFEEEAVLFILAG